MQRRTFLRVMTGVVATAVAPLRARAGDRVGIVGAGIIGASAAWHLARRGARVTVFERGEAAGGTTGRSFAWLNAHFTKQPRAYHLLSRLGVLAWRELEGELGSALGLQWRGAVEWTADAAMDRELREGVAQLQRWGSATRPIDAATLAALEPRIVTGPLLSASFAEDEGGVDAVAATRALLAGARTAGADVRERCGVVGLDLGNGRLRGVRTTDGDVALDRLVIAAGVSTPQVAAMAGFDVPLKHAPGIIAHTEPMPALLERIVVAPQVHLRQMLDGRIVVGEDPGPPADGNHDHLAGGPQEFPDEDLRARHGARLVAAAARFLPALAAARADRLLLGWRPLPRDGHPVVGAVPRAPDLYVIVTHSGVTMGPLLGRLAALELLDGVRTDLLEPFRPERFGQA